MLLLQFDLVVHCRLQLEDINDSLTASILLLLIFLLLISFLPGLWSLEMLLLCVFVSVQPFSAAISAASTTMDFKDLVKEEKKKKKKKKEEEEFEREGKGEGKREESLVEEVDEMRKRIDGSHLNS